MHSNPLISVIVPIYKVEEYLQTCIDSIIKQTYPNLEIILVDDGSPDRCGEICDAYATQDSRIIVVHKKNGGLSDARNAGLDISKGEYIAFVDSDDLVHPQFIELLVENAIKTNSDIVICDIVNFDSNESINSTAINEYKIIERERDFYFFVIFNCFPEKELASNIVVAWNKLYKKELWNDLRYPYGKLHEDNFVIHSLINMSDKILRIDAPLYYYRQRQESIMFNIKEKNYIDKTKSSKNRVEFFKNYGNKKLLEQSLKYYYYLLLEYFYKYCTKESRERIRENFLNILLCRSITVKSKLKLIFFSYKLLKKE